MKEELFIVVLNWNGWNYTESCLESIKQEPFDNYTIILVDNHSTVDELNKIDNYCAKNFSSKIVYTDSEALSLNNTNDLNEFFCKKGRDRIIIIKNSDNYGFAGGNNVALKFVQNIGGKYTFLLNNDTIVENSAIYNLRDFSIKNSKYVAIVPQIRLFEPNNRTWNCGGKITWYGARKYYYANADISEVPQVGFKEVDYVTGCALLLNLEETGILSERFFFGEEDFELSLRLSKKKMKKACFFESIIYHKDGGTQKKLTEDKLGHITAHYIFRLSDLKDYQNPFLWRFSIMLYFISSCNTLIKYKIFSVKRIFKIWNIILKEIESRKNFDKKFFFNILHYNYY